MDVIETIKTRRSIRNYLDKKIEKTDLQEIIECGMYAPSAYNQQAWEFYVVQNPLILQELSIYLERGKMLSGAAAAVLVCFDTTKLKSPDFIEHDMGACMENMLLATHDKGIGAVRIGVYPKNNQDHFLNSLCDIPVSSQVFSILSLGYPDTHFDLFDKKCISAEKIHWID